MTDTVYLVGKSDEDSHRDSQWLWELEGSLNPTMFFSLKKAKKYIEKHVKKSYEEDWDENENEWKWINHSDHWYYTPDPEKDPYQCWMIQRVKIKEHEEGEAI